MPDDGAVHREPRNAFRAGLARAGSTPEFAVALAVVAALLVTAACSVMMRDGTAARNRTDETPVSPLIPAPREAEGAGPAVTAEPAARSPADETLQTASGEPIMRVRVLRDATRLEVGGARHIRVGHFSVRTPAFITLGADAWYVRDASGVSTRVDRTGADGTPLRVSSADGHELVVNGSRFPGELRLHPSDQRAAASPGAFDVVEHVPIETYLPGVISKELLRDWKLEAYKAQAIAARSYALHERERRLRTGSWFDVENSEQDQVYGGATDHRIARRAVEETRGIVLTWNGQILRAYYSSTCGGRAGAARDTWPTTPGFEFNLAAPIQAHVRPCPCDFSPRHRWTVSRDRDELVRRLRAWGAENGSPVRSIASLSRIDVHRLNDAGRPAAYAVFDAAGKSWVLSAEQLRLACNTPPAVESGAGASPAAAAPTASAGQQPALPGSSGSRSAPARVLSGDLELRITGNLVSIVGRGFGHGVGMCQYGAEGMARQGKSAQAIVRHYYPGASIERAY